MRRAPCNTAACLKAYMVSTVSKRGATRVFLRGARRRSSPGDAEAVCSGVALRRLRLRQPPLPQRVHELRARLRSQGCVRLQPLPERRRVGRGGRLRRWRLVHGTAGGRCAGVAVLGLVRVRQTHADAHHLPARGVKPARVLHQHRQLHLEARVAALWRCAGRAALLQLRDGARQVVVGGR